LRAQNIWPRREGTHGRRFWRRTGGRRKSRFFGRCLSDVPSRRRRRLYGRPGCTLDVADGEFVAIVGPTGCGKSTLLNVAAGLIEPSHGSAEIFGAPLPG
jgi:ABC-type hemin transport system ATPase subunit